MQLTNRQRASWIAHLFKAITQQHHTALIPVLKPHLPVDGVAIDVGAHAGQFSKLFARMARTGQVYAFEPSSYARSILLKALRWNRITNVTVVSAGLSDRSGHESLQTPIKRSGSLGYGTAHLGPAAVAQVNEPVRVTTLDAYLETIGPRRVDLIKADIEGWELKALMGAERTIATFRPAVLVEVDGRWLARAGDTPEALFDWMARRGYHAYECPSLSPAPVWNGNGDYLFVSGELP